MQKRSSSRVMAGLVTASIMLFSQAALAHAHLKSAEPAAKAGLSESPTALALTFTEDVEPAFSGIELFNSQRQPMPTGQLQRDSAMHNRLSVALSQPLAAGDYSVNWHVLSVDGHKTKGSYRFSVK